jgi:nucleoside-diphosphate-sugar epimerase
MGLKILFIGGTGIISSASSRLVLEKGHELYLLNRGKSARPVPEGAKVLTADIHDPASVQAALGDLHFDVVVNWIVFDVAGIKRDIELFGGRTNQYVFISSASAYQTPPASVPVTESAVLDNPHWEYSRNKIACEERLIRAYRETKFPFTTVRPSHTYDKTLLPMYGGYTVIDRLKRGEKVIVHGDGTSLWTMTHHADFAKGFVGLLGNARAVGETFHITSDEVVTWNQIIEIFARELGVEAKIVHVPSTIIAAYDKWWGEGLLGDKTHSMIFDNSKIKRFVPDFQATIPFSVGAREIMEYYADPAKQKVEPHINELIDRIIEAQERALPQ